MTDQPAALLVAEDPPPVVVERPGSPSPFLVICDHAGRAVPARLGDLGLPAAEFDRHIAYDIGAEPLARRIAERLDAVFIRQSYSRLVIDCNRDPSRPDAILHVSDGAAIPANVGLDEQAVRRRIDEIHAPYHRAIAAELDRRARLDLPAALILVHSFTPELAGRRRPWHLGVLHLGDSPLAATMLRLLAGQEGWVVGDNEPYAMDGTDYTAPHHAGARGYPYLELEVRQDLIADAAGQDRLAALLAPLIETAGEVLSPC